jgi:hypothetical protein
LLLGQIAQEQAHHNQINREHEQTFGLKFLDIDPQTLQRAPVQRRSRPQPSVQHHKAFDPQQRHFGGCRAQRFPEAPAIGSCGEHEKEKQEERAAWSFGE